MIEWDNDRELRLIGMRREGHTFSECATALGVSRSAVAGKCRRLRQAKSSTQPSEQPPLSPGALGPLSLPKPAPRAKPYLPPSKRALYDELRKAVENTK